MNITVWKNPRVSGYLYFSKENLKRCSVGIERYGWGEPKISRVWWAVLGFSGDFYLNRQQDNQ